MAPLRQITVRTARLRLDEDGIVRWRVLPGILQIKADAVEGLAAFWKLAGHRRRPVLVDLRRLTSIERKARLHYASATSARYTLAVGMLVGSPLSQAVGNFFLGLDRPAVPCRLFTSEAEALCWLQGFIVEAEGPAETGAQITLH